MSVVIDLCGGTGSWSKPYRDAGYMVRVVDPATDLPKPWGNRITVFELLYALRHNLSAHADLIGCGLLMAPPCTAFSGSGARWWKGKDASGETAQGVAVVRQCLEIKSILRPRWWALENPVGRIARLVPELGKWRYSFQPNNHGDPYTKRTLLWGEFNTPARNDVEPTEGGKIWRMAPSPDRAKKRSITPSGFARAFFEANP